MEHQTGARYIAKDRGAFDAEPLTPRREPAPIAGTLAERLSVESILAVLPVLKLATIADFEREYGR